MRTALGCLILSSFLSYGCAPRARAGAERSDEQPPPAPREFRAAWVATVANIDWPSRPGLSTDQQQAEAMRILDTARELNLNAIILQVRCASDALYESRYEPWSYYLTGVQGQQPDPLYDPLEFWIDEAHNRGIELHAWFNPYRARHGAAKYESSANHVSRAQPQLVREFNGWQWLDPANPGAQELSYNVFMDVVKRYDVDGIHIDDYFYPYPDYLKNADFPDDDLWQKYQQSGGTLSRGDWRRDNVNQLIQRIYDGAKRIRKTVKFGISPFGIARPGRPPVVKGFDQFEKLYADAELWLREGWCDYWTPQLYWKISATSQPYQGLLEYWVEQNAKQRHIWPGNFTSRVAEGANPWEAQEVVDQVVVTRQTPGATGNVHFSMKALVENRGGVAEQLKSGPYAKPALVPPSPWLDDKPPAPPKARAKRDRKWGKVTVSWRSGEREKPWQYAIWTKYGGGWNFSVMPGTSSGITLSKMAPSAIVISAVDRSGNESKRVHLKIR